MRYILLGMRAYRSKMSFNVGLWKNQENVCKTRYIIALSMESKLMFGRYELWGVKKIISCYNQYPFKTLL